MQAHLEFRSIPRRLDLPQQLEPNMSAALPAGREFYTLQQGDLVRKAVLIMDDPVNATGFNRIPGPEGVNQG